MPLKLSAISFCFEAPISTLKINFILKHAHQPDLREIILLRCPLSILESSVVTQLFTLEEIYKILDFTLLSASKLRTRNFSRLASLALSNYEASTLEPILVKFFSSPNLVKDLSYPETAQLIEVMSEK